MSRYLHHITISTGHTSRSYRNEVIPEAIQWGAEALATAARGERVKLEPIGPGYTLQITVLNTRSLIATVWLGDAPVVTFGVASHSRAGAPLWRSLIETATVKGKALDCPPEPWLAARIEPGAALAKGEALATIADLERCLAWAFLELPTGHTMLVS